MFGGLVSDPRPWKSDMFYRGECATAWPESMGPAILPSSYRQSIGEGTRGGHFVYGSGDVGAWMQEEGIQ